MERGGYVFLLDVGGKIQYEEIPDRKSGKLVPGLNSAVRTRLHWITAGSRKRLEQTFTMHRRNGDRTGIVFSGEICYTWVSKLT